MELFDGLGGAAAVTGAAPPLLDSADVGVDARFDPIAKTIGATFEIFAEAFKALAETLHFFAKPEGSVLQPFRYALGRAAREGYDGHQK